MTPAARLLAAIDVLDQILGGEPVERTLTNWGRNNRFAGSGDRAAIRDTVYDALRCRRSFAALGGAETGRGLVLGGLRDAGLSVETFFTGVGHAPAPVEPDEQGRLPEGAEPLDIPDWLVPSFQKSLGADYEAVAKSMRHRAPVFLRTNFAKCQREEAIALLAADNIVGKPHPLAESAIEVLEGQRKVQTSQAYLKGLVELQDAASQAIVELLPLRDGMRVLDHCAGGGGKALAMAARAKLRLFAHDVSPRRMNDLPNRAKRAGVSISLTADPEAEGPYDLVLADAPCSGSGSWRRDPQGKWSLDRSGLQALLDVQAGILDRIARLVAHRGVLAYATCSLLAEENFGQIRAFRDRHPEWFVVNERQFTPLEGGDGFYISILTRADSD